MSPTSNTYIGLMSGTSLDGVDGVLVSFPPRQDQPVFLHRSVHLPFSPELKQQALALQQPGDNEIHREALLAHALAHVYAECAKRLQPSAEADSDYLKVRAIGAHGQTIRHRPELGYTRQTNQGALLAELTGIDTIVDFRSRDIAAGGQGAPLVPAFHRAMFAQAGECRVVVNIGGMANVSILHADGSTQGFDTGPGNVLMDSWIAQHRGDAFDRDGAWAAQGRVLEDLLALCLSEAYFDLPPPKSTGRDLFDMAWLSQQLSRYPNSQGAALKPVDVQATLCQLTVRSIASAILIHAPDCRAVYVCGGGAYNQFLMAQLRDALPQCTVESTQQLGIAANHVEAIAFAWLAWRFVQGLAGNLPQVTGASGDRILGALYPA